MVHEDSLVAAAKRAQDAVSDVLDAYRDGTLPRETSINGALAHELRRVFNNAQIAGLTWHARVLTSEGGNSEERQTGADLLIHVEMDTPALRYSKGVLVQAKRVGPDDEIRTDDHRRMVRQCGDILRITPASFVFSVSPFEMRCGSAIALRGIADRHLHQQCCWTSYRFFLELFRCPIGDNKIRSQQVEDLNLPYGVELRAQASSARPSG